MDYFAGLDVSVKETSVCIVDDAGKIVREARVASEPEALLQVVTNTTESDAALSRSAAPAS
jgi:transposase